MLITLLQIKVGKKWMNEKESKWWKDCYLTSEEFINVTVKDNLNPTDLSTSLQPQSILGCLNCSNWRLKKSSLFTILQITQYVGHVLIFLFYIQLKNRGSFVKISCTLHLPRSTPTANLTPELHVLQRRKSEGSVSEVITMRGSIQKVNHFLLWKIRCVSNYMILFPFPDFLKITKCLLDKSIKTNNFTGYEAKLKLSIN